MANEDSAAAAGAGAGAPTSASSSAAQFPALILDGLQRHVGKLRQATTRFEPAPQGSQTWAPRQGLHDAIDLLVQNGGRVRDTATKFSLVLSHAPAAASIKSISDEMRTACDTLVAALGILVDPAAGAGPPLMELYCQQVRSVLRATEELVRFVANNCLLPSAASGSGELAPRTGVVWAACEQLGKLPRSNKVAFRRALLQHQSAVRDTLREFREMLEEDQEDEDEDAGEEDEGGVEAVAEGMGELALGEGEEGDGDVFDDDDDDFFGGSSGPLREWERTNVQRCLVALGHGAELLRGALAAVDEATQRDGAGDAAAAAAATDPAVMQAVARIEERCQALTAAVVNAADALYPPQICQELESQLGALVEAAAATAAAVAELPEEGGAAGAQCQAAAESVREASSVGVARGEGEEPGPEQQGRDA